MSVSTRADLKTFLNEKTGLSGEAYEDRKERYINFAQSEICITQFNFLKKSWTFSITVALGIGYEVESDFGEIDYDNVWISTTRLVRGSEEDIILNPPATTGQPLQFVLAGVGTNNRQKLNFGNPTTNASYTATVRGWRKPTDLTLDTQYSIISQVYGDKPLLSYAEYLLWASVQEKGEADRAYRQFIIDFLMMEEKLPFTGPSYAKILRKQLEEQTDKDNTQT